MRQAQEVFASTGGLHAAALFTADGELLALREDVGRHNALDKVIGARALGGELPLHDSVLLVSGRVSFEIVQKAGMAGSPIMAAISAPTDLAVATAQRLGMTLVGFLRGERFNIYTGRERIDLTH
jgi:FdhD protein